MQSFLYYLLTSALVGAYIIYMFFKYQFSYWRCRRVPYVQPSIPFGNLITKSHILYSVKRIYDELKGLNPFVGAYSFFRPVVLVTDLDLVKDVLIRDFSNFTDRGIYYNERDDPLSAHLFTVDGEQWRNLRIKLTSTFTSGKMKFMFSTIVKVADQFQNTLSDAIQNENEIEMKDYLASFMTDVIGTCAYGIECNSLKDPNAGFRLYGRKIVEDPRDGLFGRVFKENFKGLSRFLRLKVINDDVSAFFLNAVRETVKYREENNVKRNDFMGLLIDLKNSNIVDETVSKLGKLTVEEIAAQAAGFFFAGFETSSTALTFSLYELALNEAIQNRARDQVNSVLQKHDDNLTYEAMMEMTYLDQILSESLRKYPPVVMLLRSAKEDYTVESTKEVIQKDREFFIPVYSIHHDPYIYPEPEVFNPDRFLPEAIKARHPMAFLAFGDGPRNCIGLRFARMQSRIGLAILLKHFKFSVGPKTPRTIKFATNSPTLSPEGGVWLQVEKI